MMKRWLGLWAVVGAMVGGCTVEATIDLGVYDFNIDGAWTVDGQPATQTLCDDAGIDRVKLVATSTIPSGLPVPVLDFSCAAGGFTTVDYPLEYGTYNFQWQAYDGATQVYIADVPALTVNSPTVRATLATFDIPLPTAQGDFSLAGSWTIGGDPADIENCTALGIDTIAVVTAGTGNPAEVEFEFLCEEGSFHDTENLLPYGAYVLRWEARDATGAVIVSQENPTLTVNDPLTMATIAPFDIAVPSSMLINLTYDTTSGPTMTDVLCEMTNIHKIYYRFFRQTAEGAYDPAAEVIANELGGAGFDCTNSLFFAPLDAGFYTLYIEASVLNGGVEQKILNATANDMELFTGEMTFYNVALSQ